MSDVFKNIKRVQQELERRALEAQRQTAEAILERAVEIVPVATGELRDSGKVTEEGHVVFTAGHAVQVHELPDGRGFKFLVKAGEAVDFEEIAREVLDGIA